jgi:hypothetical protein
MNVRSTVLLAVGAAIIGLIGLGLMVFLSPPQADKAPSHLPPPQNERNSPGMVRIKDQNVDHVPVLQLRGTQDGDSEGARILDQAGSAISPPTGKGERALLTPDVASAESERADTSERAAVKAQGGGLAPLSPLSLRREGNTDVEPKRPALLPKRVGPESAIGNGVVQTENTRPSDTSARSTPPLAASPQQAAPPDQRRVRVVIPAQARRND